LLIADSREQTKPAHPLRIHLAVFGSKEGYQKEPSSCSVCKGRREKINLIYYLFFWQI
jgi:hypothetical protein